MARKSPLGDEAASASDVVNHHDDSDPKSNSNENPEFNFNTTQLFPPALLSSQFPPPPYNLIPESSASAHLHPTAIDFKMAGPSNNTILPVSNDGDPSNNTILPDSNDGGSGYTDPPGSIGAVGLACGTIGLACGTIGLACGRVVDKNTGTLKSLFWLLVFSLFLYLLYQGVMAYLDRST